MQVIKQDTNTHIIYWLAILIATIFTMIVVGGITRLTDSGLSMVGVAAFAGHAAANDRRWNGSVFSPSIKNIRSTSW